MRVWFLKKSEHFPLFPELGFRFVLLALYFALGVLQFPHWQFSLDDLNVVLNAQRATRELFFLAVPSSIEVLHLSSIYYLYSFPFHFIDSLLALQIWITLILIVGHFFLIEIGKNLGSTRQGYLASLAIFFSPSFFNFYSTRFWEQVTLPALTIISFWSLLSFLKTRKRTYLFVTLIFLTLSTSSHLISIFLLPVFFFSLWDCGEFFRQWKDKILVLGFLLLMISPFLYFFLPSNLLGFSLLSAAPFLFLGALYLPHGRRMVSMFLYLVLAMGLSTLLIDHPLRGFWQQLANLFSGLFNVMVKSQIGMEYGDYQTYMKFLPEVSFFVVAWIMSIFQISRATYSERVLFLWISVPMFFFFIFYLYMPFFIHTWFLIFFPLISLVAIRGLFSICVLVFRGQKFGNLAASILCFFYLGLLARQSFIFYQHQAVSGWSGQVSPNLEVKQEIVSWIFQQSKNPKVFLITHPLYAHWHYEGAPWRFLLRNSKPHEGGAKERFFYLLCNRKKTEYLKSIQLLAEAKAKIVYSKGPVKIFESEGLLEGVGVSVY